MMIKYFISENVGARFGLCDDKIIIWLVGRWHYW